MEEVREAQFDLSGNKQLCVSKGSLLYTCTLTDALNLERQLVLDILRSHATDCQSIVELGCGYGFNLGLALSQYPEKQVCGGDFSENAVKLGRHLGLDVRYFNFYLDSCYEFLSELAHPILVFTCHAVEQIPDATTMVKNLCRFSKVIRRVVHLEPSHELQGDSLLGMMRRRYIEVNDYNRNLVSLVRPFSPIMEQDIFGINESDLENRVVAALRVTEKSHMNLSARVGRMWRSMPPGIRNLYHRMPMPIRRLVGRAVFEDQQQTVEVQTGIMRGTKLRLFPRSESGYYLGTHEPDLQEGLPRFIKPGMTVFDIGANIGFFAVAAANLVGQTGKVVAFEPNPAVVTRLRENVELNGLADRLKIEQSAVGDFDGTAEFCFALTHLQGRFSDLPYVPEGAESTPVPCRTIDSYVASTGLVPDVVIMDVEHAEGRALRGMKSVLQRYKPLVFIEMHGPEAIREAFGEIVTAGYTLWKLPSLDTVKEMNEIAPLTHFLAMRSESAKLILDSVA